MAGTAVLYRNDEEVIVLEDVDQKTFNTIKKQCGHEHCTCTVNEHEVDFGNVKFAGFKEDNVDWEYGY